VNVARWFASALFRTVCRRTACAVKPRGIKLLRRATLMRWVNVNFWQTRAPGTKPRRGKNLQAQKCVREKGFAKPCGVRGKRFSSTAGVSGLSVHGNTDLKGATIASTAAPDKNSLTTGNLTFSDIANSSSYDARSSGFSAGASMGLPDKVAGPSSVSNSGGITPSLSQHDSGSDSATTKSAISAGTINVTDQANQTQNIASLNRDTSNTNGTVSRTPDVNALLDKQADMMLAAAAAGQAVAQRIGDYAQSKYDEAKANHDQAGMDAWKDGGSSRAEMQAAGAAVVAGLGGGAGTTVAGAVGAGAASLAAGKLNGLSDAIAGASPTGNAEMDKALGNIVANAVATGAGYVAGNAGAFEAGNVDLYNRTAHEDTNAKKPTDLVAQVCPAGAQCIDPTLNAAILAQGMNADAASANLQTMGAYGAPAAALALIGPEAVAAVVLAGGLDYGGSAYSYWTGLSKDKPNFTNSYVAGVVGGLTYPSAIGNTAIAGMGTAGRIAANAYNAGVAGVGAFGAAGMTGSNPDLSGGLAAGLAGTGTYAKAVLPGPLGEFANQLIQGMAGPLQNYIQNNQNPTKK